MKNKIDFTRICNVIKDWRWDELEYGINKSLISYNDIKLYALLVIEEESRQFDELLSLIIADEDELKEILDELIKAEERQKDILIKSKWGFAIINDMYMHNNDKVLDVIDEVYTELDYLDEISNLVYYMPSDDNRPLDKKIEEYIQINRKLWC